MRGNKSQPINDRFCPTLWMRIDYCPRFIGNDEIPTDTEICIFGGPYGKKCPMNTPQYTLVDSGVRARTIIDAAAQKQKSSGEDYQEPTPIQENDTKEA